MNRKAFTLIELLVVVAIIGILAAVGVVAYNGYTKSAKIAVVKSSHKLATKFYKTKYLMQNSLGRLRHGTIVVNHVFNVTHLVNGLFMGRRHLVV